MRNLIHRLRGDTGEASTGGGIGLPGVLFVVFLVLKLTGTIGWSWWWITAPFWIGFGIWAVVLFVILFAAAIFGAKRLSGKL